MLKLRHGVVANTSSPVGATQELSIVVDGQARMAMADLSMVGESLIGDEVVVNTQAVDLQLGSGGFDVVHVNLTRGLAGEGVAGAHVMKLNYTSLQHAVLPVEGATVELPLDCPVAVCGLHGQLAPVAWAFGQQTDRKLGFVQTFGGALPGGLSRVVLDLRTRGLLVGHLTAGATYGGEGEAVSTAGAIAHGVQELGWDAVVCGPGPGILGSGSQFGHGGMEVLNSAHTALALGCPTTIVPRMSTGDGRPRHQGLSHHTRTVLELLLAPVSIPLIVGYGVESIHTIQRKISPNVSHDWVEVKVDINSYAASGLPAHTMGRSIEQDEIFFASALAGGVLLAA